MENYAGSRKVAHILRRVKFSSEIPKGNTTLQGNLFPRNVIPIYRTPRNFISKEFFSKEFFSKERRFQGKLFPRNFISKDFFSKECRFQGKLFPRNYFTRNAVPKIFLNTLFHILINFLQNRIGFSHSRKT
jgi:hypothetical protein